MSDSAHNVTATQDRIPFVHKTAYALGMLVNNLQAAAMGAMAIVLNLGLGMNPALVGLTGSIPRVFDALTDPMMGYISDNTRSRYGRRRQYIFAGALLSGIIFILMWQFPAGRSESYYFWFFLIASVLFFFAYTIYATPFIALGYEMTTDYHERTRLQAYANWVGQIAWLIAPWFYAIMNNQKLAQDKVQGAGMLAVRIGIFVAIFGMIPALLCREKYDTLPPTEIAKGLWNNLKDFFKGFAITFKCSPFMKLCAATFLVFNGYQLGAVFTPYVLIYYLYGGDDKPMGALLGWFGTATSIGTFCIIPLAAWISKRVGKRNAFLIMISISLLGYALKWVCYRPDHPYWLLYTAPLISFGIGSLFTLMGSMVADVCDYDETNTGRRREGMFGAIYWWMVKVGMAMATLIAGFLLNATGFDVKSGATQSADTLFLIRLFDVGVPLVTSAIAIAVILTYDITEKKAREIRVELERRRQVPAS